MLKIQKDESIHSFIYRSHVVNGVSDFSNIITQSGDWASFPKILKNTLHLYQPIDDSKFLYLLRDIGLAPISDNVFDSPVTYRTHLLEFFGQGDGKTKVSKRATPIRYCLHCIKEHIQKFGYGVIDVTWARNFFCPTHESALHKVKAKNRKEAIEAVSCILRGVHPTKYEKPSSRTDYFSDSRKYYHEKNVTTLPHA